LVPDDHPSLTSGLVGIGRASLIDHSHLHSWWRRRGLSEIRKPRSVWKETAGPMKMAMMEWVKWW
jgi:hypothetical protein